jgi:hypothetical protein
MNDDEIRLQLITVVPEHRTGFWEDLRRGMLVTPSSGVPQVGPPVPGVLLDPRVPLPGTVAGPDGPDSLPQPVGPRPPAARAPRPRGLARWATVAAACLAGSGLLAWQGTLGPLSPASWWGSDAAAASRSARLPASSPSPTTDTGSPSATGAQGSPAASPTAAASSGGSVVDDAGTGAAAVLPHLTTLLPVDTAQLASTVLGQVAQLTPAAATQWLQAAKINPVGTPLSALSWVDRQGRNVLLITRTATAGSTGNVTMRAYLGARLGRATRLVGTVSQQGGGLWLAGGLPSVTDADADGNAEASIGWLLPSASSATSLNGVVAVVTEGHQYVLRGSRSTVTTAGQAAVGGVASKAAGVVSQAAAPVSEPVSAAKGAVSGLVSGAKPAAPPAALPSPVGVPSTSAVPSTVPAASGVVETVTRVVVSVLGAVPAASAWPAGLYDRTHQQLQHMLG